MSSAAAQPAPSPERTIGAIALLAGVSDHTSDGTLREALRDPDPSVRIVAARVIAVVPHGELLKDIIGALAREKDSAAAAELGRSVLYLSGSGGLDMVNGQAARFGPALAPVIAEWTARMQPERFPAALPGIVSLTGGDRVGLAGIVRMAAAMHPVHRDAIFRRWMDVAPERAWSDLMERAFTPPFDLSGSASLFRDALASTRPAIRQETVWFLLHELASTRMVPSEVLEAALPVDLPGQTDWERLGRELVSRRGRKAAVEDRSDLLKTEAVRHRGEASAVRSLPELTAAERAVLTALYGPAGNHHIAWTGPATARTLSAIVPGLIAATLSSAGCNITTSTKAGLASITFHRDGRPQRLAIDSGSLGPACLKAFTALARMAVADSEHPITDAPQTLMLPMAPAFVACSDAPREARSNLEPVDITAPRKLRDVKPGYPDEAQRQRIQGVVILSAVVTSTGCVSEARVVRSIPFLDVPAVLAVSQWVFEPARIGGVPQTALMTVNLNFELR
jgi:TonB family protein